MSFPPLNMLPAVTATTKATAAARGSVASGDGSNGGKIKTAKSRKRVNTAEKRASHNAVERQRREALNGRFLDLARILPSLANSRRPSKSAIVNGSISYVTMQREQRLLAAKELRILLAERDALLNEVNDWRSRDSLPPKHSPGVSAGVEAIFKVEDEVFGTFAAGSMGGDDDEEDDVEQDGPTTIVASALSTTPVSIPAAPTTDAFHPAFTSQSFSSDVSFSLDPKDPAGAGCNPFFGAGMFPKLEAMTPPSSDSQSPQSQPARYLDRSPDIDGELEAADKVSSWAAEQLFNHIQSQQHQPAMSFPGQQQQQREMPSLAGQHHGQNPFTATLLANIAATQQRAAFNVPLFDAVDDANKSYSFPTGPAQMFPAFQASHPAQSQQQQPQQLDAWRSYALAQYQLQPQPAAVPALALGQAQRTALSMDELKDAVRAGMGFGMSMVGGSSLQPSWPAEVDAFSV